MAQVKRAHLQNPYASDILMPREDAFLDEEDDELMIEDKEGAYLCDPYLELDLSDFLEDLVRSPSRSDLLEEQSEILMEERESCCESASEKNCECDSTFISYLPEPEHSMEMPPFDQTFDNMEFDWAGCENQQAPSNILKRVFSRSRFASSDVTPLKTHSESHYHFDAMNQLRPEI